MKEILQPDIGFRQPEVRYVVPPRMIAAFAVIFSMLLAQVPFSAAEWIAEVQAPGGEGTYNLIIEAFYEEYSGSLPLTLTVGDSSYVSEGLTVEPVYPIGRTPPITLRYEILVDGTSDFTMLASNVTFYYVAEGALLSSEAMPLELGEDGNWYVTVNVPLKGDYEAVVQVALEKDGQLYGGDFITQFTSDSPSPDLMLGYEIDKHVLVQGESFEVSLGAAFQGSALPYLEIFKANIYGKEKTLIWDSMRQYYSESFTAPSEEGMYLVNIYAEGQDFSTSDKIYVADTSQSKSARCPLAADLTCMDMKDVRKCVLDSKNNVIVVEEDELVQCFINAIGEVWGGVLVCEREYKGDLDGDLNLDEDDLELLQYWILPLSQSDRQTYVDCADYDLDGDVDEQDLECLTNVVSKKWHGNLRGGICFDAEYESAFKCDLDGNGFIEEGDVLTLGDIVDAADEGIEVSEEILEACDFNEDGKIDGQDKVCLGYFKGMDLDDPNTLLAKDQRIPDDCMKIYDLDECRGVPGDLNGDYVIDEVDQVLEMLVYQKQVSGYNMSCADVNGDGFISDYDVVCVVAYVEGDKEQYYICIGCDEYTPQDYRYPIEICNDGYDNDCDGLVDRTDRDGGIDYCQCGPHTPCEYVWDVDSGNNPGIDDGNVLVCRSTSWESEYTVADEYQWTEPGAFICTEELECESVECANKTMWKCAFDGLEWDWYAHPDETIEETTDPLESPVLCEDGYDNDCRCGDAECDEPEESSMFENPWFWAAFVVGFALSFILPGWALLLVSLLVMVANFFVDDPDMKAALSGFSMGMSAGSLVNSGVSLAKDAAANAAAKGVSEGTKEAASKAAEEAASKAIAEGAGKEAVREAAREAAQEAAQEAAKTTGEELSKSALRGLGNAAAKEAGKAAFTAQYGATLGSALHQASVIGNVATTILTVGGGIAMLALGLAGGGDQKYIDSKGAWKKVEQDCS